MFSKLKKIAIVLTNSLWILLVVGSLFGTYGIYLLYNNCYDQTKEELIEKISKETDDRFSCWVNDYIKSRFPEGPEITVCVSENDLITGALIAGEHATLILIRGENDAPKSFWSKMRQAQHVPVMVIRPRSQSVILEHLSETHKCTTECVTKQHALQAVIDHECTHIYRQDLTTLLAARTIGNNFFIALSLLVALILLWSGYHAAYIASPYTALLAVMLLSNTHLRYLEQRCDEAICNDEQTLHGWITYLNDQNLNLQTVMDENPAWLGHLNLRAEHEDGFWGSPLFGSHPPINTRIAQARERIKTLKKSM